MVIVLSGFNGIEELVEKLYSSFDADIRITKAEGKTFDFHEKTLLSFEKRVFEESKLEFWAS